MPVLEWVALRPVDTRAHSSNHAAKIECYTRSIMGEKKKQTRQALYRKYRSKSLDEIIGQEHITKTLSNALKQGKISHAYLFTGPRGTGKTSIARILAHEINQLPYTDESTHLDIIEIDAASNRRIDDIRDLRDKVHIVPLSVKYKVYIIDEVHMLTTESFNALLKTLEEPPEHVVFMLATTEVHKLPATIISRTQRHSLKTIGKEQVAAHLSTIAQKEKIDITDDALELLAIHGNGSFRDSISLLDQLSTHHEQVTADVVQLLLGIAPTAQLQALRDAVNAGNAKLVLTQLSDLLTSGLTPSGVASQLAQIIRDLAASGSANQNDIDLLAKLLTVHSAIYQQLTLESILLGAITSHPKVVSSPSPKVVEQAPVLIKKAESPKLENKPEPISEIKPGTVTSPKDDSSELKKTLNVDKDFQIEAFWPKILEAIKSKNNPLYTVMRLAHYALADGCLTLSFGFPFHKKRIDESKNKAVVAEVLKEVTGYDFEIETTVDKNAASGVTPISDVKPPAIDPAHASVIDGVRDIMGGGEIVNV